MELVISKYPRSDVAMPVDHDLKGTIQPTALRAPEVNLGIKWDTAIDIWGAGCVVHLPYDLLSKVI